MTSRGTTWFPGTDLAFVWDGGVLMIALDVHAQPCDDVVRRIWDALDGQVALGGVLQLLTEALGASLLNLPDFAVALVDGSAGQVAARGRFRVVVSRLEDTVTVEGLGVTTWSERAVDDIVAVSIGVPTDDGAIGLPIECGVVPSSQLTWGRPADVPLHGASADIVAQSAAPEVCVPAVTADVKRDPSPVEPAVGDEDSTELPVTEEPEAPVLTASATTAIAGPADELGTQTWTGEDNVSHDPDDAQPPSRYAAMWGDTVAHSIEDAAVRIDEEESRPGLASAKAASPADDGVLISVVPGRNPGASPAAPAVTEDWSDHDGATIVGFNLATPAVAAQAVEVDPQSVLALVCLKGHPNRPHVARCRECGADLAGGITSNVPRPALGQIRASTGEQVPLTGPVLIGRSPRAARFQGSVAPRLLSLPYPHISSTHLEVRLEGWNVFAVDLDSMNGAYLRRRDEPPVRVTHTPLMLADADVIDFGHGVSVTFEGMP